MSQGQGGGQPKKFTSVKKMEIMIDKYFESCDQTGRPYTISGLALALDCDRRTILNYRKIDTYQKFFLTLKKAVQKCENYAEEKLFNGRNVAGVIFNLKNNYKWEDKQEVAHGVSDDLKGVLETIDGKSPLKRIENNYETILSD